MKFIILAPVAAPRLFTAQPPIRKLGDHAKAFDNVNNAKGWREEPVVKEADHPAPLYVGMRSYEIAKVLIAAANHPHRVDALTTGLPRRLLIHFQQVEAATLARQEAYARGRAKKQAKKAAERHRIEEQNKFRQQGHAWTERFKKDLFDDYLERVTFLLTFVGPPEAQVVFSRQNIQRCAMHTLRKHVFGTTSFYEIGGLSSTPKSGDGPPRLNPFDPRDGLSDTEYFQRKAGIVYNGVAEFYQAVSDATEPQYQYSPEISEFIKTLDQGKQ